MIKFFSYYFGTSFQCEPLKTVNEKYEIICLLAFYILEMKTYGNTLNYLKYIKLCTLLKQVGKEDRNNKGCIRSGELLFSVELSEKVKVIKCNLNKIRRQ